VLPNVRELPLRLERVVADGLGRLVGSHAASRAATTTINHPEGSPLMRFSTRHAITAIVAASCLAIPATASAMPYEPPTTTESEAAQAAVQPTTDRTDAATPMPCMPSCLAQAGSNATPKSTFPSQGFSGDNPADHPGMSRAPQYDAPTTIEVVRPQRTVVRDVDQALPIALAGTALVLVLVLAMIGVTLVRTRLVPRPGRSH
jgi:hypothetical protein